jgi:hypothetical protein
LTISITIEPGTTPHVGKAAPQARANTGEGDERYIEESKTRARDRKIRGVREAGWRDMTPEMPAVLRWSETALNEDQGGEVSWTSATYLPPDDQVDRPPAVDAGEKNTLDHVTAGYFHRVAIGTNS